HMASWYDIIMVSLVGWQLQFGLCSGGIGNKSVFRLMNKYSETSGVLTIDQLQQILDQINCHCPLSVNKTDVEIENSTSGLENCSYNTNLSLTAKELFTKLNIKEGILNVSSFQDMCPVILEQLESKTCSSEEFSNEIAETKPNRPSAFSVWGVGFLCVTVINLSSLLGAIVFPFMQKNFYKNLLIVLIGLAVGSLSASSLFHLIPQFFVFLDSDSNHAYLSRAMLLWFGIWVFFMIERIMKMITDYKSRNQNHNSTKFPRNETSEVVSSISSPTELLPHLNQELEPLQEQGPLGQNSLQDSNCLRTNAEIIYGYQNKGLKPAYGLHEISVSQVNNSHGHDHMIHFENGKVEIATVAWMIIFGDSFHNFIDGLSIGAALHQSLLTGISISVAVLCEEVPHEL
ncbi:hypothetical protein L9F63_024597, partial [Diploptera punctata]